VDLFTPKEVKSIELAVVPVNCNERNPQGLQESPNLHGHRGQQLDVGLGDSSGLREQGRQPPGKASLDVSEAAALANPALSAWVSAAGRLGRRQRSKAKEKESLCLSSHQGCPGLKV
jgi:hypothetical protein